MITHGNLFSGSGTWELAAQMCGIKTLWEAEIEPFPVALEAKRFPDAIQLGDVSKISGADIPPVDIFTNSSPCQDLSNANKTKRGLEGERSGLFLQAVRICKEMRNADIERQLRGGRTAKSVRPRPYYFCWENVPGALQCNAGADYRVVLQEIIKIVEPKEHDIPVPPGGWHNTGIVDGDGWEIAWRILDPQGDVPQRRRRVFLVASLTDNSASEILFESPCVHWDYSQIMETFKATSATLEDRIDKAGRIIGGEPGCIAGGMESDRMNPLTWDARGNGDGKTVNTLVGGHQNSVSDYTALIITS